MNIHEKLVEWEKKLGKNIFKDMKIPKNAVIADFGCGYGEYTIAAAKYLTKGNVLAIDNNQQALNIVKKKIQEYKITNVEIIKNGKELHIPLKNETVDILLFYDMIHGNYLETKLPTRFDMYPEAYRTLKLNGILSIAPFHECDRMKDKQGRWKKYTKEKIIDELKNYGFEFVSEIDGGIHFENSRSPYLWKKFNNNMQFEDIEKGPIWNFMKIKK